MVLACQSLDPSGADYEVVPTQQQQTTSGTTDPPSAPSSPPVVQERTSDEVPAGTAPSPPVDAGVDEHADAMVDGPRSYGGALAANTTKAFGGSGQCRFTVTMENIHVVLAVDGGKIVDADVKADMIEKVIGTCGFPSIQTNTHEHVLDKNVDPPNIRDDGSVALTMYRKSGAPATILFVSVARKGDAFEASLTWKRDDGQAAVLMWTTSANVSLHKM
jgi:hypothetical protein